jgi:hypothetical protein
VSDLLGLCELGLAKLIKEEIVKNLLLQFEVVLLEDEPIGDPSGQ